MYYKCKKYKLQYGLTYTTVNHIQMDLSHVQDVIRNIAIN